MKGGLLLDVVVGQGSSVFELFTGEDQSLLIWRDSFLVLNFRFDVLDSVGWLDFKGNGLTSQGFHKNLHTASESENKVEG